MKKVLLGTTALLAAGIFAGPALGQAAAPAAKKPMTATNFDLTLGGFSTFTGRYQDRFPGVANVFTTDKTTNEAGTGIEQPRNIWYNFDAELAFRGTATLATGLKGGFVFELEVAGDENNAAFNATNTTGTITNTAQTVDYIDDAYMYVDGKYGKVTMGGFTLATYDVGIARTYTSAAGIDQSDFTNSASERFGTTRRVGGGNEMANPFTSSIVSASGTNWVQWELPSFAGFRTSLAFNPDGSRENTTRATEADDAGGADNRVYAAAQWAGKIAGNNVRASAAVATDRAEDVGGTPNTQYRLGADIALGNLTIGGQYKTGKDNASAKDTNHSTNNGADRDERFNVYGIGATYTMGVYKFGVAYETAKQEERPLGVADGNDKANRWDVGIDYTGLGNGRTIRVGLRDEQYNDNLNNPANQGKSRAIDIAYEWDVAPGLEFDVGYTRYRYTHHQGLDNATEAAGLAGGAPADQGPEMRTANAIKVQTKFTF